MKRGGRYQVASKAARTVDGIVFDSKMEAARYAELKMLERAGSVSHLELQPEYVLVPAFVHDGKHERAIKYRADFRYRNKRGEEVVEDVKGHRTDVYKLKRKLLLYHYPFIDFREV